MLAFLLFAAAGCRQVAVGGATSEPTPTQETKTMNGPGMPKPKRVGQPDVEPVTIGGMRFEVLRKTRARGFDQNGGIIAAVDAVSGKEQWTLKVYTIHYIPKLETDVQDIFITALSKLAKETKLLVSDERGRRFEVDIAARSVKPLP
jgi:hypothetical protein